MKRKNVPQMKTKRKKHFFFTFMHQINTVDLPEAELATHDACVDVVEAVIADRSPRHVYTHFQTTFAFSLAIDQS